MSEKNELLRAEEDLISSEIDEFDDNDMDESLPTYSSIFEETLIESPSLIPADNERTSVSLQSEKPLEIKRIWTTLPSELLTPVP